MKSKYGLPQLPIKSFHLKNGLQVIVSENHSVPMVTIAVAYDVGGRSEKLGRSGFAHLFEHMMFQGSANLDKQEHFHYVESRGGSANGFTMKDFTVYYETLPSKDLALGIWLEADRMRSLAITQENFDNQKDVVQEEKRMRYENQPYMSAIGEEYPKIVFSNWSNQHSVIGSFEDLDRATIDDLKEFFRTFYTPSNAVLVITGDAKAAQVKKFAEKYFGSIPAGVKPTQPDLAETSFTPKDLELGDPFAEHPMLLAGWRSPGRDSKLYPGLVVLGSLLVDGEDSRLYRRLVKGKEIALDVSGGLGFPMGSFFTMRDPSIFSLMVRLKPSTSKEEILKEINSEIASIASGRVKPEEMERARRKFKREFLDELSSSETCAHWLGIYTLLNNRKPDGFMAEISRFMDQVKMKDVVEAAQILKPAESSTLLIKKQEGAVKKPQAAPARRTAPALPVPSAVEGSKAEGAHTNGHKKELPPLSTSTKISSVSVKPVTLTLKNGLKVVAVEDHRFPFLKMRLAFPNLHTSNAADVKETTKQVALRGAASELFKSGTSELDSAEIENRLASLGADMGADAGLEHVVFSAGVLSESSKEFLGLFSEILADSSFPQKEIQLWKENSIQELNQSKKRPEFLLRRQLAQELFGTHPNGVVVPTPDSIQNLRREEILSFYRGVVQPRRGTLVVVGDFKVKELQKLLEGTLGRLPAESSKKEKEKTKVKFTIKKGIVLVDRPGSPQSNIALAQFSIDRKHPDYYALTLANAVLGYTFNSRLASNLRENKGYTYSIRSGLDFKKDLGLLTVSTPVRAEVTSAALKEILSELDKIRSGGITERELSEAKNFLLGLDVMRLGEADTLASRILSFLLFGLPLSDLKNYSVRLARVTKAEVERAASKYVNSKEMATIIVGNAESVLSELKDFGPVRVVDIEGKEKYNSLAVI